MNRWVAIYRFSWVLLLLLCVLGSLCMFLPKCRQLSTLRERRAELEAESRRLEEEIHSIRMRRRRFAEDPSFVERTAREEGMVKSDETVYRVRRTPEDTEVQDEP